MNLEQLQAWLGVFSTVLGILITLVGLGIPLIKNIKAKETLQATATILEMVKKYMIEAEGFLNLSGEEKKKYVIAKAIAYAAEHGITITEEEVGTAIEGIIYLSKSINFNKK